MLEWERTTGSSDRKTWPKNPRVASNSTMQASRVGVRRLASLVSDAGMLARLSGSINLLFPLLVPYNSL